MEKNIEIISLIYKSTKFLNLIANELKSDFCKVDGWNVGTRLILNDATDEIKEEVKKLGINYSVFDNDNLQEFYLNRVYKAYNYGVTSSAYDNICFVNSDMIFSKDWLKNLLTHHDGINIPTCNLIEPNIGSSPRNVPNRIEMNFGKTPDTINYAEFYKFAEKIKAEQQHFTNKAYFDDYYSVFMPIVFEKKRFIESGMYPSNMGNSPADRYYYQLLKTKYQMRHITVLDSIAYHIQRGEINEI